MNDEIQTAPMEMPELPKPITELHLKSEIETLKNNYFNAGKIFATREEYEASPDFKSHLEG